MHATTLKILLFICVLSAAMFAIGTRNASAQEDPQDVVEAFAAAVVAGDAAAASALFADDIAFTDISTINGSFGAFGKPAASLVFEDITTQEIDVEFTDLEADDETGVVTGVARISDVDTEAAGVDRYLQPFSATVVDGLLTALNFTYNENDAQTRTYLEFVNEDEGGDDGGEEPGIGELEIELGPGRDGSQTGTAFFFEASPEVTGVGIAIEPGANNVLQPAHVHDGDCPGVGAIASPLASVLNGFSFSFVSLSLAELSAGDYAINVHQSAAQAAIYVSCGEVGGVAVEPSPTSAPPAATATPATGVIAPDTGTGPSGQSTQLPRVVGMLVIVGVAVLAVGALKASRATN
jgi:hypothetical protein